MSRKMKFRAAYKLIKGRKIYVPGLRGKDGGGGSGGGLELDPTLNDPNKAAPANLVGLLKDDYAQQIELLKDVRDALKGGDIPGAIGLLDTYLLDKEVLA